MSTQHSDLEYEGSDVHEKEDTSQTASSYEAEQVEKQEATGDAKPPVNGSASEEGAKDPDAPPDGGLVAWLQVFGAFVLFFNTWGLLNTFGVYQAYYESGRLFTASSSNISWIGSVQAFLMLVIGTVTGPIFDAGHLRILLGIGTFGVVFGHMMLSLVHTYWEALLAQAFVIGLGAGCLFMPSIAMIPQYFTSHIGGAMGIAVSGSSLGGVIYPIMFNKLVPEIGFPWAVRTLGFFALALLVVPLFTMKMRKLPPVKRSIFDKDALKNTPWVAYVLVSFVGYIGLLIPFFYVTYTSIIKGFASEHLSFYLLPILNAASTFGRLAPGVLADKYGAINLMIPTAAVTALLSFCILAVHNFAGLVVITAFYGFWSGAYISLPPTISVKLTPPDKRHMIGTRMGMGISVMSLGVLIGNPVAGAIAGSSNNLTGVYCWSGATLATACIGFFVVRYLKVGTQLMVKV